MAGAMHQCWESDNLPFEFHAISPSQTPRTEKQTTYYNSIENAEDVIKNADILMLGVKPQMMAEICGQITHILTPKTLILTIAAGLALSNYERMLNAKNPTIRIMPNTPSAIGKGISAFVPNAACDDNHIQTTQQLLQSCGSVYQTDDEHQIDIISTISGSGPAYFYYFTECLANAATHAGLPEDWAHQMARETFIGAAALADHDNKTDITQLRQNVTSKGGTTAAALGHIMDGKLQGTMNNALQAAIDRANELKKNS